MEFIVDANIIFSALIRDGITAKLMFLEKLKLYAPEFLLEEVETHRETLLKKTHLSKKEFETVLEVLSKRIIFIPKRYLQQHLDRAYELSPDPNDSIYFAAALEVGAGIWTNDKRLKGQDEIRIYNTTELFEKFKLLLE